VTEPFTLYGATTCDDTERTRGWLNAWGVAFREVNIDEDPDADAFVRVVNQGFRSTPTLVFGAGRRKVVLTEPSEAELREMLASVQEVIDEEPVNGDAALGDEGG
jgi:mycoredoxin